MSRDMFVHALGSWVAAVTVTTPNDVGVLTAQIVFAANHGSSTASSLRLVIDLNGRERDMAAKLAVFVGDQRHRRRVASAKPLDDPALSLVAVRMIGECGGNDLIDFAFIAGSFVADRHGLRAPDGVIQLNILASRCRNSVRTSSASFPSTASSSSSAVANFSASLASGRESNRDRRDKDEHHCGRSEGGIADGPHDAGDAVDPGAELGGVVEVRERLPIGDGHAQELAKRTPPLADLVDQQAIRGHVPAHLLIVPVEDLNGDGPVFEPAMK